MPRLRSIAVATVAVVLLAGLVGPARAAAPSPACLPRAGSPRAGILSAHATRPDKDRHPRLWQWAIDSRAMSGTVRVNVLLPAPGARGDAEVLYLLHGHGGNADNWWKKADDAGTSLEAIVGDRPLIVVMPDGGYDGWYSDWYGVDADGHDGTDPQAAPAWETFHLRELVPFIDQRYPNTGRMIAGLSMGGYGAMAYAARHPDLFDAAGSFSGALDTRLYEVEPAVQPVVQNAPDGKAPDNCVWGDYATQRQNWIDHNPADQAVPLARLPLYVSSGDGCFPSPSNPDPAAPAGCNDAGLLTPQNGGAMFTEWGVRQQNQSFLDKVTAYCDTKPCAPRAYDFYASGVHAWPDWLRELGLFLRWTDGLT